MIIRDLCICCSTPMQLGLCEWHRVCPVCSYESGDLISKINDKEDGLSQNDENLRALGLIALRKNNFQRLLNQILQFVPVGSKLLDVGCAHGWLLEAAKNSFKAEGIEPDREIFERTLSSGLSVRYGYFPDDLVATDTYDVITFNDVIEHIPNFNDTVQAIRDHLNTSGVLVLNLPSSGGVFYRVSKFLHLMGIRSFFNRLWQTGMPSPHVHYFNSKNLTRLLNKYGFTVVKQGRLESIVLSGLYERISYARRNAWVFNKLIYLFVASSLFLLRILPSDIIYVIATRKN